MSYDMQDKNAGQEIAVSVKNLSKAYRIFDSPGKRLSYHLFHTNAGTDFWALRNVSFDIKKGEAFGIIGKNGSGKSTMLQILAGIIKATEGTVEVNGRIAALLELGSGFNPESTGYENIYMNAAILGVKKNEIEKKIQEIVDFADIGDFIHQPVKTYSSGMYIRLAFAVAINVDADIILIDEALAVGDVFFRQKCYAKLNKMKKEGKTIILVSHGMNEVEQFCDRALLLSKSEVVMVGDSRDAVQRYYVIDQEEDMKEEPEEEAETKEVSKKNLQQNFSEWAGPGNGVYNCTVDNEKEVGNGKARFLKIGIFDKSGNPKQVFHQGEEAYFYYEVEVKQEINVPLAGIVFYDQRNTIIFGKDSMQTYVRVPAKVEKGSTVKILFNIKMDIAVGEYTFDAGFNSMKMSDFKQRENRNQEEVNSTIDRILCLPKAGSFAVHERLKGTPMKIMFHGCCDLQSNIELLIDGEE